MPDILATAVESIPGMKSIRQGLRIFGAVIEYIFPAAVADRVHAAHVAHSGVRSHRFRLARPGRRRRPTVCYFCDRPTTRVVSTSDDGDREFVCEQCADVASAPAAADFPTAASDDPAGVSDGATTTSPPAGPPASVPSTVTRVVLVHADSTYTEKWAESWDLHVQDDGRTLKLFPRNPTGPRYEHTPGFFETGLDHGASIASEFFPQYRNPK